MAERLYFIVEKTYPKVIGYGAIRDCVDERHVNISISTNEKLNDAFWDELYELLNKHTQKK